MHTIFHKDTSYVNITWLIIFKYMDKYFKIFLVLILDMVNVENL